MSGHVDRERRKSTGHVSRNRISSTGHVSREQSNGRQSKAIPAGADGGSGENFKSVESLQHVVNVINETSAALQDKNRTIAKSAIPEVLGGVLGAGSGAALSFGALYGLGTVGLSAAGITSGLATAGALVGGGMAAGVIVLALPVAALAVAGTGVTAVYKQRVLAREKERLYMVALEKHQALIEELREEVNRGKERMDYLVSLNILLERALRDLAQNLGRDADQDIAGGCRL